MPDQSPQAETRARRMWSGDLADVLACVRCQQLNRTYRDAAVGQMLIDWEGLKVGDYVLLSSMDGNTCTIERAMPPEEIERQALSRSLCTTVCTCIGFPLAHVRIAMTAEKLHPPPAPPPPETRIVGDGYAPGTDALLHFTVQGRDGKRITAWRQGTVWSASPEPRSIDEIAAQPDPADAGELPTGQFKIGDCVEAVPPFALVCGSGRYDYATVVSVSPFVLASEQGDMLWKTVSQEKVLRIGDATWSALYSGLGRYAKDAGLVSGDKWLTATTTDPGCFAGGDSGVCMHVDAWKQRAAELEKKLADDSQKFGVAYIAWRERVLKLNNGQLILPDESQEEYESWLSRAEWGDADDEVTALRDRVAAAEWED